MARVTYYQGKDSALAKDISMDEFMKTIPSRSRRSLKRGLSEQKKILLANVKDFREGKTKRPVKTHCRDMVVIPEMVDVIIEVYNGRSFHPVHVTYEMLGHFLGEFAPTRHNVKHSSPGIGATKSTASASVK
jgi:small subunit ribosomal protein S19